MPSDVGSQTISLKYGAPGNSAEVNERFKDIRQTGIYSGGILEVVDGSHCSISPLVCEIQDGTYQVRVATTTSVNLAVTDSTPYVILRWSYTGNTSDYMEIKAVATPSTYDLVVGKCSFSAGSLTGFDYGDSTYPRNVPNTMDLQFKVIPVGSSLRMWVFPGYIHSQSGATYVPFQKTDALVAPGSNSRVFLVYLDPSTGTVNIDSSGTAEASPSAPDYDGRLVLAEVTLSSSTTAITSSMIKDVRAHLTKSPPSVDGTTITLTSDGKLKQVDPEYLVLRTVTEQVSGQSEWTKITSFTTYKQSGISASDDVITLNANKFYKISYAVVFQTLNSSPIVQARLRVLTGDLSWEFRDDDNNVSLQQAELSESGGADIYGTLSGTYLIIPESQTTLQLEATTQEFSQNAKVLSATISIWT